MEQNLIQTENQVQVQNVSVRLRNGKERLEQALMSSKIGLSSLDELKQVLRLTMLKLGIRANNLPSDEEKAVLIAHIIEFYGNFSCDEIVLAFNLAMTDKLSIDSNEVNSYENFSCLYFSRIMNAYKEWTIQPRRDIEIEKRRLELPYEERACLSDKEFNEWYEDILKQVISNPEYDFNFLSPGLYSYLEENGTIKYTNEQKTVFINQSILVKEKNILNKLKEDSSYTTKYYTFLEHKEKNDFDPIMMQDIKLLAKKIALLNHIKKVADEMRK